MDLPTEIWMHILSYLDINALNKIKNVNTRIEYSRQVLHTNLIKKQYQLASNDAAKIGWYRRLEMPLYKLDDRLDIIAQLGFSERAEKIILSNLVGYNLFHIFPSICGTLQDAKTYFNSIYKIPFYIPMNLLLLSCREMSLYIKRAVIAVTDTKNNCRYIGVDNKEKGPPVLLLDILDTLKTPSMLTQDILKHAKLINF